MAIYLGGLAVIVATRTGPDAVGVPVSEPVETVVVVLVLTVMACTYVAERAVRDDRGADDDAAGRVAREYTTGQRGAIALGLGGIAVGGFFAFTGRLVVGVPFVVGAVLLLNWAFENRPADDLEPRSATPLEDRASDGRDDGGRR
ncbi:hypothetical protein [Natronolimnohabitans innermongolicus]|uniref:Uncharacterized protein n=1 Tax=Natronolimnohabitans innermongolicus JCM 12255 TaxID=1227499 RepID=L9XHK3_9EURY|nr:hypothetical protein [Natronolimnohabitans innermongolicus]ELY61195.1 hypothetical protein C493_02738 [Natronolimnohabitans innermongolicus JCM 12255]